jgi:nucleotide-binding universal stress UspA family protein
MYKRILVPLDGSTLAEQALPHATAQAARFEAEIVLLKVLEPLPEPAVTARSVVKSAETASGELARDYLRTVEARIREQELELKVQSATTEGKPYLAIIRFAEENDIDLIVMATRGQSGLSRWLMGSVADRVVRGATVPLLLIQSQADSAE